jgi:MFS family permease
MRYVRFAPPMHAVLFRSGSFILSASALWSLLPLVAKNELHSESQGFGLLLGCLGVGSVIGALLIGRIRRLLSPDTIATSAVALFGVVNLALAYLENFGAVTLLMLAGGVGWMCTNSTLSTAAQTSLPAWVRARALAVYLLVFQGAMAVGSVIWGEVASRFGLRTTLAIAAVTLMAAAAATSRMKLARFPGIDITPSYHWPEPPPLTGIHPEHGPVLVTVEYLIDPRRAKEFAHAMQAVRQIRRRDGAIRWGLYEDAAVSGRYLETFVVESWAEHLRQHERVTKSDQEMEALAQAFHQGPEPPKITHLIAARD